MTRIATMVAAGLMTGGLLLAPGAARACEAHARPAEAPKAEAKPSDTSPAAGDSRASQRVEGERPLDALDALMAGKCQCGSKADCTCKKGACDCAKCKKPGRQVMDALRGRPAELKLQEARYDASAGIFI